MVSSGPQPTIVHPEATTRAIPSVEPMTTTDEDDVSTWINELLLARCMASRVGRGGQWNASQPINSSRTPKQRKNHIELHPLTDLDLVAELLANPRVTLSVGQTSDTGVST